MSIIFNCRIEKLTFKFPLDFYSHLCYYYNVCKNPTNHERVMK